MFSTVQSFYRQAEILEAMSARQGITLILDNAKLVTVEATDIFNISRPFLSIGIEDMMKYQHDIDQEREVVLDQLVADAQEQDLGIWVTTRNTQICIFEN